MSSLIFLGVGCHGEWWEGFHSSHALVHVQFMRVFCSARKLEGRACQTSLTTLPSASPVEGSRRSGAIRMQNALKNASIVAGWGGVEDGCEFVGDVY